MTARTRRIDRRTMPRAEHMLGEDDHEQRLRALEFSVPTAGAVTFPWAVVYEGPFETNSGVDYDVGGQEAMGNTPWGDVYTLIPTSVTYPGLGLTWFFQLRVEVTGIYLVDCQATWESWGVNTGNARLRLDPDLEAWYPLGSGALCENDNWVQNKVVADGVFDATYGAWFRVNGIAYLEAGTTWQPNIRQESGVNNLAGSFCYLKLVKLQDFEATDDLYFDQVAT